MENNEAPQWYSSAAIWRLAHKVKKYNNQSTEQRADYRSTKYTTEWGVVTYFNLPSMHELVALLQSCIVANVTLLSVLCCLPTYVLLSRCWCVIKQVRVQLSTCWIVGYSIEMPHKLREVGQKRSEILFADKSDCNHPCCQQLRWESPTRRGCKRIRFLVIVALI